MLTERGENADFSAVKGNFLLEKLMTGTVEAQLLLVGLREIRDQDLAEVMQAGGDISYNFV